MQEMPIFSQAVIKNFHYLSLDQEEIVVLFPMWQVISAQNGQSV